MKRDLWIAASKKEIKAAWSSTLAHFAQTPAGRYCVEHQIDHRVTEERSPRITLGDTFHYLVEMTDLDDEHTVWFKLSGYTIVAHGTKPDLPVNHERVRFLPDTSKPVYYLVKSLPSK